MIKDKFKNTLLTKQITDIIDEVKKPQSLNELKAKFGLPLRVKVVVDFVYSSSGLTGTKKNTVLDYCGEMSVRGFWLAKQTRSGSGYNPNSKKFILWE